MQSTTLVALLVVVLAVAHAEHAQTLLAYVPANYQSYLNSEAKSHLSKLSIKDVNSLRAVANQASHFTSLNQLKAAIQKASPQATVLASKYATQATAQYNALKNKLSPKSQNFFGELATLSQNFAKQAQKLFQKQDAGTKANLGQVFSHVTNAAKTPAGKALLQHFQH